jgi:tetratricopeptide (TPR) repeat protein
VIAEVSARWLAPREHRWADRAVLGRKLLLPMLAVCAAPVVIIIGRDRVLSPIFDPFMARLHSDFIQEFLPIWMTVRSLDARSIFQMIGVDHLPLIAAIATLSFWRREAPVILWFATAAALLFNAMAWWQTRWLLNASGVQVCLAIVLVASWTASTRLVTRWAACIALALIMYVPSGIMRYTGANRDVLRLHIAPRDATGALHRDIAVALRESQPQGDITLLTSPNASTGVGYYGRFKTLGTLYWENRDGLKAAAAIYSAPSEEEAAKLIKQHGVTHIAIISEENFIYEYFSLLHPGATANDFKKCFGYKLLYEKTVPQWLQMLPYRIPDDLVALKQSIMLFKVNFQQNLAEAFYNVALAQITSGAVAEGERTLDILLRDAPKIYQPWLRKGELLLARHDWSAAADHILKGISLAPPNERAALYVSNGGAFYLQQQPALALKIYRAGMADQPTAELSCYLAWILATSRDDALRNGRDALPLAEAAVKAQPTSPTFLNSLAAALAENGKFKEAAEVADRALANARLTNNPAVTQISEQNLAAIRANQPIRK